MFVDSFDRELLDDAKLARMHPDAHEAKMKARAEWNPMRELLISLDGSLPERRSNEP